MGRIRKGLHLTRISWDVLRQDGSLLLLPLLSGLAAIAVIAATFFGLFWDEAQALIDGTTTTSDAMSPLEWVVFALVSYVLSYIAIFFNVALMCAADERMNGGDPTVASALRAASEHARAIAPWAAVSVVVQSIIRAIEDRGGIVGQIVGTLIGVGWALATYLILPVLIFEGVGVREAFTRSKNLFIATWGELVTGEIGMSLIAFLISLLAIPSGLIIAAGGEPVMIGIGIGVVVAWFIIVGAAFSAMNAIFRVALYRYATEGAAPAGFESAGFDTMFPPRRKRRMF
jgi:hypothetical protein